MTMYRIDDYFVDELGQRIPMPMTACADMEPHAEFVRSASKTRNKVAVLIDTRESSEDLLRSQRVALSWRRFVAPAPFVGDPRVTKAAYVWIAWMSTDGRYVACDADLMWMSPA